MFAETARAGKQGAEHGAGAPAAPMQSTGSRSRPASLNRRAARQTGTREVWPWSLLVPWLEGDLRARAAANPGRAAAAEAGGDPYDSPAAAMPLREFLEAPLVAETLHNGSALQARAGLC